MAVPSTITVSNLATSGGVGQVTLTWDNGQDECLSYLRRLVVEVWASTTNDRSTATKIGESTGNIFVHSASRQTRYYWIRVRNVVGGFGDWFPSGATAGVSGIATQAASSDIGNGAVGNDQLTTFSADKITTGTLNASLVSVTNLNASNITTGTLNASLVNVTNLNASNITTGTLNAINVTGSTITGASIVGGQYTNISTFSTPMYLEVARSNSRCLELWGSGTTNGNGLIAISLSAGGSAVQGTAAGSNGVGVGARAVGGASTALVVTGTSAITSGRIVDVYAESTSFTGNIQRLDCYTAASSSFSFLRTRSSAGGSRDTEHLLTGDGNGLCDGSWTGGGADYAEYFESLSGDAIPIGTSVVLDGDKVRAATEADSPADIMGVVRPKNASVVVGNAAWNRWHGKYLKDDYGAPLMEEYTLFRWTKEVEDRAHYEWTVKGEKCVSLNPAEAPKRAKRIVKMRTETIESENANDAPERAETVIRQRRVLNPEYDPGNAYTPRSERPEWCVIGLMGQIPITKGQPVNPNWRKMRDISPTVEMWLVR